MELSKEQQAAVVTDESRVLVAVATGSGKAQPYLPTNESMMRDWINIWN